MKKQLFTFLALIISGIIFAQVGIGTTDPKSGLDINTSLGYKVTTISSATTLDDTYNVVLCNNGPYTVTLPPAAANTGRVYRIKNIDPSGDAITIDGNGSETIDGELTYLLQPYKHSITLISNGVNWYVVESHNDGNYVEGAISSINCSGTNNGTLVNGVAASGVNSVLSYTGGNAGTHSGQTVTSTGVTGLTATLSAGTFANGAGSLTYTITGTPSGTGTASFAVNIGGQTCTLTRTVAAGAIASINCSGTDNGTLVDGVAASGVNSVLSYTGGNAGTHSGQTVTSTGVTGLTATLSAGTFANGAGSLTYTITGTPSGTGTASFAIDIGGQSCSLTRNVEVYGILFADSFNRPDGSDLNASAVGKSGYFGALNYGVKGDAFEISSNQLKGGDFGAGGGWGIAYISDHNFIDAQILTAGGFSISIDLAAYLTAGSARYMSIGVGQSLAELTGASLLHGNSDLLVGYRWTTTNLEIFKNGVLNSTTGISGYSVPQTMRIDYVFSDFNAGSTVSFEVYLGSGLIKSGTFTWSGTNENYISIHTNLSSKQARFDNFKILLR